MATLKDLRNSIASVKSTQRITSAMKMVAAAKLKRAQTQAEAARPYADKMKAMLRSVAGGGNLESAPPLLVGSGEDNVHLLIVVTSDRGLCGGFNANIIRDVRKQIKEKQAKGKQVKLIIIGRKGSGVLRREFPGMIEESYEDLLKPAPHFEATKEISNHLIESFKAELFDSATIVYNRFESALSQIVTYMPLIPFGLDEDENGQDDNNYGGAFFEFEPDEAEILKVLVPQNLAIQIYRAFLESFASEQGARMAAMDNATRNAGDMISKLSITYNRRRQAQITSELIEIISGAEAL